MVKIDRSLITDCDVRPDKVSEIERLLRFAQAHGVGTCAEGVETVAELVTLRSLGVPFVQGYLLGRPEPHWIEPLLPSLRVGALPPTISPAPPEPPAVERESVSWTSAS